MENNTYTISVYGTLNNALQTYTIEASSREEALEKYNNGEAIDSEINCGDFESDSDKVTIDDVEEVEIIQEPTMQEVLIKLKEKRLRDIKERLQLLSEYVNVCYPTLNDITDEDLGNINDHINHLIDIMHKGV